MTFKHRDFRILWLGQFVSKLGSQFNYIALAWLVLKSTDSAAATGGVYLAQVLPIALLGWVAGVPVDKLDKRKLMFHCDWLRGLLVLVLPIAFFLHDINNALIYAVTFLISTLSLFFYAAEKTVIPAIVPEEDLTQANAFAEMTEQLGALIGPVMAGILIGLLPSPVYILYLDAFSFFFSAFTIFLLNYRDPKEKADLRTGAILKDAKEGLLWLLHNPMLKIIFLTAMAINFLAAPFTVVFPIFSERVLHAGSQGFGWLMGGFGLGMLLGTLSTSFFAKRFKSETIIYVGMAILGVGFYCMAYSPNLTCAVIFAAITAYGVGPGNAVIVTLIQTHTPEDMLGRTFASMSGLVQSAIPIGVALASFALDYTSSINALKVMGVGSFILAIIGYIWLCKVNSKSSKENNLA